MILDTDGQRGEILNNRLALHLELILNLTATKFREKLIRDQVLPTIGCPQS